MDHRSFPRTPVKVSPSKVQYRAGTNRRSVAVYVRSEVFGQPLGMGIEIRMINAGSDEYFECELPTTTPFLFLRYLFPEMRCRVIEDRP